MTDEEESPYDEHGVDVTLIRSFLKLTPAERLERLVAFMNFTAEIRRLNGIEEPHRDPQDAS